MSLSAVVRTSALALVVNLAGCFLDRSAIVGPRPDAAADGGLGDGSIGFDSGIAADAGVLEDAGIVMDGGSIVAGSRFVPSPLRPAPDGVLPPTRGFFLSQMGEVPAGRTVAGIEFCQTSGPADTIDEESECPNGVLLPEFFQVLDPLTPNTTYRWKVRARYDDGRTSEWSAVQVFSTDDSLVGWWRLNGDATDSSSAGNDGTLRNGVGFGSGIDGQALQCDGANDHVDLGTSLALPGPLAVSAWIYGNGVPSSADSGILNQGVLNYALTYHTDGRVYFYIGDGGNSQSVPVGAGAWHHVLGTFDGTTDPGGMRIYLDGTLVGMRASSRAATGASGSLWIGRYNTSYFNGRIANAALFNEAISDAAVLNEFCATQAAGGVDPLPAVCQP